MLKNFFNLISNFFLDILNSLNVISLFKLSVIIFFIFLNLILIYFDYKRLQKLKENRFMATPPATPPSRILQAGPIDSKIATRLKNYGAGLTSLAGIYSAYVAYKQDVIYKKPDPRILAMGNQIEELKKDINSSMLLQQHVKVKMNAISADLAEKNAEMRRLHKKMCELRSQIDEKEVSYTNATEHSSVEKESILDNIKSLKTRIPYYESELNKKITESENLNKDLESLNNINESFSFSFLDISFIFDYYHSLPPMGQIFLCLLVLNQVVFSSLISVVFVFYGDYLIKKFKIEDRYPRLAKFINLRRKFQKYYLLLDVGFIIVILLFESVMYILILMEM